MELCELTWFIDSVIRFDLNIELNEHQWNEEP